MIGRENISEATVRNLIFAMLAGTLLIGLYLTFVTGWLLLVMGLVVCFIGVFYTFGPIPLSRMPLGEVFSGVTMGLGILPSRSISIPLIKKFLSGTGFCERNLWLSGESLGCVCHRVGILAIDFHDC